MGTRTAPAALGLALVLTATACTSDGDQQDVPTAAESAAVVAAAEAATGSEDAGTLPPLVDAVAAWRGPLPPELAAKVLDAFAAHPDALRSAATPNFQEVGTPVVGLDRALEALTAAGADDDVAADFRTSFLGYVRTGLEQAIRARSGEPWYVVYDAVNKAWGAPAANVVGAVEAGCRRPGCRDRMQEAELATRDAIEAATYTSIPAKLLPKSFFRGTVRIPMADWTTVQRDDWIRLRDMILIPLTNLVHRAAYKWMARADHKKEVERDAS